MKARARPLPGGAGAAAGGPAGCRLPVKATPNAPRDGVAGWTGGVVRVRVHAPSLEGRANEALCAFLAAELGLARRDVVLEQGTRSRTKIVLIRGLSLAQVQARLGGLPAPRPAEKTPSARPSPVPRPAFHPGSPA